jgi:hypothetical protein
MLKHHSIHLQVQADDGLVEEQVPTPTNNITEEGAAGALSAYFAQAAPTLNPAASAVHLLPLPGTEQQIDLLAFLQEHQDCLKCTTHEFHRWLLGQDVIGFEMLRDACQYPEYVKLDMQPNGLKGYKLRCFLKAIEQQQPLGGGQTQE